MAKLVLTGFRAFPGVADNPTQALVEHFRDAPSLLPQPHKLALLDVDYRTVESALDVLLESKPAALMLTGYSNLATRITLEAQATGICSTEHPDVCGFVPNRSAQHLPSHRSNADLDTLHRQLQHDGIEAEISQNAGEYLCNFSYRHALSRVVERRLDTRVLFVHLPALAGTALAETAAGTIGLEQAVRALALVAKQMARPGC